MMSLKETQQWAAYHIARADRCRADARALAEEVEILYNQAEEHIKKAQGFYAQLQEMLYEVGVQDNARKENEL